MIDYTVAFTRFGHLIGMMNKMSDYVGSAFASDCNDIYADYVTTDRELLNSLESFRDNLRSAESAFNSELIGIAQQTIIAMIADDLGVEPSSLSVDQAVDQLRQQMELDGESISLPTITVSKTSLAYVNSGSGDIVYSNKTGNGLPLLHAFDADTINFQCISDSYVDGGASAGAESFSVISTYSVDNESWEWPHGSGLNTQVNAGLSIRNSLATDSSFESWSSTNELTLWTRTVGAYGTVINKETHSWSAGQQQTGLYAIKWVLSGANLEGEITQEFSGIIPAQAYAISLAVLLNTVTSGTIKIFLRENVTGGSTLVDDAGNNCEVSITVNNSNFTVGTYSFARGILFTPTLIPEAGALIVIEVTAGTALNVSTDDFCIVTAGPAYPGGPQVGIMSGYTVFAREDKFQLTVSANNNRNKFSRSTDRLFGLRESNIRIPASASPTISDSLITI